MRRLPWLTLAVAGVACLVHATPGARGWLVFDRAIVAAEPWRLATGSLVHWSLSHLLLDLAAFGAGAMLVERRSRARLALLLVVASIGVGASVHLLAPGLARYAGLSGVAYAVLVAAALDLLAGDETRGVGLAAVAALAAKLWLDVTASAPLLVDAGDVVAAPVAHVAGSVAALALWWCGRNRRRTGGRISRPTRAAAPAPTPAPHAPAAPAR